MQNILPKIKISSLSIIKVGLPGKRTFKSSLSLTDFIVPSPNFIGSEPFDTQNGDISLLHYLVYYSWLQFISLLDYSFLHLDHKYL